LTVQRLRKKEFSSFDIAAAIQELKGLIADSRVNNIYQLDEKTVIFKLHKIDTPPIRLVMEAGRRLHTTDYAEENPAEPPAFCMTLRKYLRDAWVAGIDQYEFERIVTVSFRTKTGLLKLVVELFGEGNIILTNDKNVIIHALAFKKMRDRDILHNVVLELPPSSGKNPFEVTKSELEEAFKNAPRPHQPSAFNLGVVYLHLSELEESNKWFRKAVEINRESDLGKRAQNMITQHAVPQ